MNLTTKDQLIHYVVMLENFLKGKSHNDEVLWCFYDIVSTLLSNDGYQTIFNPDTIPNRRNFLSVNYTSGEKIGITLNSNTGKLAFPLVWERMTFAYNYPYNRLIIFSAEGFTSECHRKINRVEPVNVELLDLNDIKNWVSRIETATDLEASDYENLIKILSRTFIERIAENPNFLKEVEWRELEKTLAEIFAGLAFRVKLTPPGKDGGKDLILEMIKEGTLLTYIVEIKHWKSEQKVGQNHVKEFIKVVCNEKRESGLFISTYGFTENAFEGLTELERTKVRLGTKEKIVSLCKTYLRVKSGIWTPLQDLQEVLFEQTI